MEPPFALVVHFVFPSALDSYPMAKIDIAFDMNSWHVAMTFAGFERLESLKSLFPPSIKFAPNKPYLVELCFTPVFVIILIVTLNGDPLTEPIAVLLVVTDSAAMPLPFFEREKHGKALIPGLFRGQPFALSKHHKITIVPIKRANPTERDRISKMVENLLARAAAAFSGAEFD